MTLSPVLARELAGGRARFNAQVAAAGRARTGFDTVALAEAVRVRIDPLSVAVEVVAPERVGVVVDAAFVLTVTLTEHGLAGERRALVDRLWRDIATPLAKVIAERPEPVLAMLTNAVLTLAAVPGARPEAWITRMAALGPLLGADTISAAGQVAAWRAGMAHYRRGAITAADSLPEPLALAALDVPGNWGEARAALAADRWWTSNGPSAGTRFGGFSGFDGPFTVPPEVRAGPEGFFVRSGDRYDLLVADAWGATLHPAGREEFEHAPPPSAAPANPTDFPAGGLRAATTEDSIAFTSPLSHFIEVRPWRR